MMRIANIVISKSQGEDILKRICQKLLLELDEKIERELSRIKVGVDANVEENEVIQCDTTDEMPCLPNEVSVLNPPCVRGDTYISYKYPKALAERWRNYFNNQMVDISHELRKDYHFVGSTDRIHVFGRRPYIPAIRNWEMLYPDCPKEFLTGKKPIREPLLYCQLCNNYVRNHGHKCKRGHGELPEGSITPHTGLTNQPTLRGHHRYLSESQVQYGFKTCR